MPTPAGPIRFSVQGIWNLTPGDELPYSGDHWMCKLILNLNKVHIEWPNGPTVLFLSTCSKNPERHTQSSTHLKQRYSQQLKRGNDPTDYQQVTKYSHCFHFSPHAFLVAQLVKNLSAMQEIWVPSLGWEDPLEKGKATHSVFWPGEFHGLYSPWGRRVGHDWANFTFICREVMGPDTHVNISRNG